MRAPLTVVLHVDVPAHSTRQCAKLLAADPELLWAVKKFDGWMLPPIREKNLIGMAEALIAEREINKILGVDEIEAIEKTDYFWSHKSAAVLTIPVDG